MPIVKVGEQKIKFPDDMQQADIQAALTKQFGAPKTTNTTAGMVAKFGQGLGIGLTDELQAALASGIGGTVQRVGAALGSGITPQSYGDIYEKELNQVRQNLKAAEQEYPIGSAALEIAGGVAPALTGYGAAGKLGLTAATTPLRRRGKEALLGGIGGAIYGFNTGESDANTLAENAADRAGNAAYTGLTSAALSPAFDLGAEKVGKVLSSL